MEKKKDGKTLLFAVGGVIGVCLITLGITYAYWILTRQQTGENVVNTACLNITFTGENDIMLDKAYPMNEEQLENFLSSATPYHFTIHNECDDLASASINLESLNVVGKALEDEYIDAILYEDDYNTNLNTQKKLNSDILNDENKVIKDAKHAYSLYNFTLKANEERDFNLLLYMDPDTPMVDANMNASWKGKITLSSEYQEENTTIRKIDTSDTNGMWGYKDKLTQIVIENKKSVKIAEDGGKVYGPFDESADGYGGVQSYVVCDAEETDCIGYLQGTNGIKANEDSSYLFNNFTNIVSIEGFENFDTSNATKFTLMFNGCSSLNALDLSSFDTSKIKQINMMFQNSGIKNLNLSNWKFHDTMANSFSYISGLQTTSVTNLILKNVDTHLITDMFEIFKDLNHLTELDLSDFDMENVTNMNSMFYGCSGLTNLNLSNFNTNSANTYRGMFYGCSSLETLDLSDFNTEKITDISDMFYGMTNLNTLNLSNWKFNDAMSYNFTYNTELYMSENLNSLILNNVDTSNVTNMYHMFYKIKLPILDLSDFDTRNVTNFNYMFYENPNLNSITFGSNFIHKANATTIGMFYNCPSQDRPSSESWQGVSFD